VCCPHCQASLTGVEAFCGTCGVNVRKSASPKPAPSTKQSINALACINWLLLVAVIGVSGVWGWLGYLGQRETIGVSECARYIVDGLDDRAGSDAEKLQLVLARISRMDCLEIDHLSQTIKKNGVYSTGDSPSNSATQNAINARIQEVLWAFDNRVNGLGCQVSEFGGRYLPPKSEQEREWDRKLGY